MYFPICVALTALNSLKVSLKLKVVRRSRILIRNAKTNTNVYISWYIERMLVKIRNESVTVFQSNDSNFVGD